MYLKCDNKAREFKDHKLVNRASANSPNTVAVYLALDKSCFICVVRNFDGRGLGTEETMKLPKIITVNIKVHV